MKKILLAVGAVVVVLIVALLAISYFVPVSAYRGEIAEQVKNATGREFAIDGDMQLKLFPRVEVVVEKVRFGNAPGATTKDMATLSKLALNVRVMPLLSGNIAVDSFALIDPVIVLEVDKQGKPNWDFAGGQKSPGQPGDKQPSGKGGAPSDLRLGDIRIENGSITYIDHRTGAKEELTAVNLKLALEDLDHPLKAEGSLAYKGETINLKVDAEAPRKLLEGPGSKVKAAITSKPIAFSYDGTLASAPKLKADGTVDLKVPSVRNLAAWTGNPVTMKGEVLGPLAVKGKLAMDGSVIAFNGAEFSLDQINAKGEFRLDSSGQRPSVHAKLDVDKLDLNPYMGGDPAKPAAKPAPAGSSAKAAGWSEEPIDFSGLKAADADIALTVGSLKFQKISVGKSALGVLLKNGKLSAALNELALYEGSGTGRIVVDSSVSPPAVEAAFDLKRVAANPLLTDAVSFDRVEGAMGTNFQVTTRGASERALVSALNGKGAVEFANGAVRGINLAEMMRNVSSAFLDASANKQQKTDFSELRGTFTITNGVLRNDDLSMLSPLLRVGGAGTVNLPQQSINYRVEPKLAATTQGQGGGQNVAGVTVPVLIEGPWSNISYKPDLAGTMQNVLKDPGAAKGLLDSVTGRSTTPSGSAPAGGEQKSSPVDALKGLLGGKKN